MVVKGMNRSRFLLIGSLLIWMMNPLDLSGETAPNSSLVYCPNTGIQCYRFTCVDSGGQEITCRDYTVVPRTGAQAIFAGTEELSCQTPHGSCSVRNYFVLLCLDDQPKPDSGDGPK